LHLAKFCQGQETPKMYIQCSSPGNGQTSYKVWLASGERRRCSNEGKTRNPLKFAGVPQTRQQISAINGPKSPYCEDMRRTYCCPRNFLVVDTYLSCGDTMRLSWTMVRRWRFWVIFVYCRPISSEPRAGHFRPTSQIRTNATPCVEVW